MTNLTNITQPIATQPQQGQQMLGLLEQIGIATDKFISTASLQVQRYVSYKVLFVFALIGFGYIVYKAWGIIRG